MISPLDLNSTSIAFGQYNISNNSNNDSYFGNGPVFPPYIRTTATVICSLIMGVGVLGNIMVPIVIFKSKDMRNSTNIFLMNLSLADIMVLLVCTPTVLVEVNSRPETWVLGEEMCRAVPFIEMMVTHASVLTILAISFERYYAICEPLKAGYICTKTRAFFICLCAWFLAGLLTSPMLFISQYELAQYSDGSLVPACLTPADTFWKQLFYYMSISLFFWLPLVILLLLYTVIVVRLMADPGIKGSETFSHRGRSQLVAMLGTVVLSFFLCLMPFRVFLPWYISASAETIKNLGIEMYFNILYFCKTMSYVHSAINPILYNLMSSKFRDGFMRVCGFRTKRMLDHRKSWTYINSLNTSASLSYPSSRRERDSFGTYSEFTRSCRTGNRSKIIAAPRSKTDGDFSGKLLHLKNQTASLEKPGVHLPERLVRSSHNLYDDRLEKKDDCKLRQSRSDEDVLHRSPSIRRYVLKTKMRNRLHGTHLETCSNLEKERREGDVWFPIVCMTDYSYQEYGDGSNVSVCLTLADTFWSKTYFLGGTFIFFVVPLAILVILYSMMALNLMNYPGMMSFTRQDNSTSAQRYRKQVILMLGTVVLFFFISLLPFRALIVWIVLVPHEEVMALGNEKYYNLLYFCRIMFYLNSAINPILYNLMSSKFRNGFFKLCGIKKKCFRKHTRALLRNSTFNTSSLTGITTSSIHRASVIDSGPGRDRSKSLTGRSLKNEQFRRNSCSKSLIRDMHSGRKRPLPERVFDTRQSRRKSFGDFFRSPTQTLNHSRSLDSVFKARSCLRHPRREPDFISFLNISGNEENISRVQRNGLSKITMNGDAERKFGHPKRKPETVREIFV